MQLLDAIIAFALTMAALATVVTVIMEAGLRIARMRKKNFIEVMKLLNKELESGPLKMSAEERWDFFVKAVKNPAETAAGVLGEKAKDLFAGIETDEERNKAIHRYISSLGWEKAAGTKWPKRLGLFIRGIFRDENRAAIYAGVSLEYMLRCLADIPSVKKSFETAEDELDAAKKKLKTALNRIAAKYEECGSSVSASFKYHSQRWSIILGILLAVTANIDGLRIFEAYRVDPQLAVAVIEQQDEYFKAYEKARTDLEKLQNENPDGKPTLDEIDKTIKDAQVHIADLTTLGVPIGWDFYPNCPYNGDNAQWTRSSARCRRLPDDVKKYTSSCLFPRIWKTAANDKSGFAIWLAIVLVSGILIGLGAPFWFDVAKRLAQIRKGLQSASASTEYRLSGANADGDYEKRKKIVENVIEQAAAEASIEPDKENAD